MAGMLLSNAHIVSSHVLLWEKGGLGLSGRLQRLPAGRVMASSNLTSFSLALDLRCVVQAFSSCSEWGLLSPAVRGLRVVGAAHCCGARAPGAWASRCGTQVGSRADGFSCRHAQS